MLIHLIVKVLYYAGEVTGFLLRPWQAAVLLGTRSHLFWNLDCLKGDSYISLFLASLPLKLVLHPIGENT